MITRSHLTLKKHGLTTAAFLALFEACNGACLVCGIREEELAERFLLPEVPHSDTMLHIDHDHRTGKVRGLLCVTCNFTLEAYSLGHPVYSPVGHKPHFPPGPKFVPYFAHYLKAHALKERTQ